MAEEGRDLSADVVIFVLGGPGAGKGTLCAYLADHFGFAHYSAGDLLRAEAKSGSEKGKQLSEMLANGVIVPSEITIGLLKSSMQKTANCKAFLIDGFPRNINQGQIFENSVVPCKYVLFLDAPQDIMTNRLMKRANESEVLRSDDNLESIQKRFKTHYETCMPVIDYYEEQGKVIKIDATSPISDVISCVTEQLRSKLPSVFN